MRLVCCFICLSGYAMCLISAVCPVTFFKSFLTHSWAWKLLVCMYMYRGLGASHWSKTRGQRACVYMMSGTGEIRMSGLQMLITGKGHGVLGTCMFTVQHLE